MEANTTENGDLALALARLSKGQEWLVKEWRRIQRLDLWTDPTPLFWKGFEEWDRLERETRARWSLQSCVIGPGGCHKDAPIRCDLCAGKVKRPFPVIICTRESRSGVKAKKQPQTALFDISRRDH